MNIPLKAYSHKHPKASPLIDAIPEVADKARSMSLPYWIIAHDDNPLGIVIVGQEPQQLTAPPGTPIALVMLEPSQVSSWNLPDFVSTATKLVTEKNLANALVTISFKHRRAVKQFLQAGFKPFDDYYLMYRQLSRHWASTTELQFESVKQRDIQEWFKTATRFLAGTGDTALNHNLQYMLDLPDTFLTRYHASEKLYFARKADTTIGILDIHGTKGWIGNMAVDPLTRRQGYGKQILVFALNQLKTRGFSKAELRVHVNNKPAYQLYDSFGFKKTARFKRLLWWNHRYTES